MQGNNRKNTPINNLQREAAQIRIRTHERMKSKAVKESFQDDSSVNLLEWIKGDRAIFWAWLYIKNADYDTLIISPPGTNPKDIPYEIFNLDRICSSSNERKLSIKEWFQKMEIKFNHSTTLKIMKTMQHEWGYIYNNIKNANWLPKNEVSTAWMWERVKKEQLFERGVSSWFNPINSQERFVAINGTLDFFLPEHMVNVRYITILRNGFLKKSENAYKARTIPKDNKPYVQVNVKISHDAKAILDKMVSSRDTTQSKMIEWLIRDSWQENKKSHEGE